MNLLKITMFSFFLSTCLHIGCVCAYYYTFLWLNPDDPGKKKFYSSTSVSPGINIGGRVVGGGGIQTNHHKSYFLHLVREHYKGLSNMFFIQFSTIYLIILVLFKFFPERSKLKEDTVTAFNLNGSSQSQNETPKKTNSSPAKTHKLKSVSALRKRLINRKSKKSFLKSSHNDYDEEEYSEEEIVDETLENNFDEDEECSKKSN